MSQCLNASLVQSEQLRVYRTPESVSVAATGLENRVIAVLASDTTQYIRRTVFNFVKHRRIEHYGIITEQTGTVVSPENG